MKLDRFEYEKTLEFSQAIITGLEDVTQNFDISKEVKKYLEDLLSFAKQLINYMLKNDPLEINKDAMEYYYKKGSNILSY